jgi:hypothetical protein
MCNILEERDLRDKSNQYQKLPIKTELNRGMVFFRLYFVICNTGRRNGRQRGLWEFTRSYTCQDREGDGPLRLLYGYVLG